MSINDEKKRLALLLSAMIFETMVSFIEEFEEPPSELSPGDFIIDEEVAAEIISVAFMLVADKVEEKHSGFKKKMMVCLENPLLEMKRKFDA